MTIAAAPPTVTVGPLTIDKRRRLVFAGGRAVHLTRTEWDLLVVLASDPERVWTRREIGEIVWKWHEVSKRTLDTHACRLRAKLSGAGYFVCNVWGVGYRLTDPVETQIGAVA